ncbi:hypothetical protein J6590_073041 [Homalodisca vitripennis]|nr:hypothetical protein J6590_073041 [Homalodisca vitripennis]
MSEFTVYQYLHARLLLIVKQLSPIPSDFLQLVKADRSLINYVEMLMLPEYCSIVYNSRDAARRCCLYRKCTDQLPPFITSIAAYLSAVVEPSFLYLGRLKNPPPPSPTPPNTHNLITQPVLYSQQ